MLTHEERVYLLRLYLEQGRVVRRTWGTTDEQGRETVCLLAALSPEVRATKRAEACPADVMPQWLALWTTHMADSISSKYWPDFARQYADAAGRWHMLDDAAWRRAKAWVVLKALDVASAKVPERTWELVFPVKCIWSRVNCGEEPSEEDWAEVRNTLREWRDTSCRGSEALDLAYHAALTAADGGEVLRLPHWAAQAYAIAKVTAEGGSRGRNPLAARTCPAAQQAWDSLASATVAAINDQCNLMAEA